MGLKTCLYILKEFESVLIPELIISFPKTDKQKKGGEGYCQRIFP